jgi:hypothetical protein
MRCMIETRPINGDKENQQTWLLGFRVIKELNTFVRRISFITLIGQVFNQWEQGQKVNGSWSNNDMTRAVYLGFGIKIKTLGTLERS